MYQTRTHGSTMKRRTFLTLAASTLAGTWLTPRPSWAAPRKPNVIIIYTDDQGAIDLNSYGAKDLATPHMDALCAQGVRFTQFYAPAPVCSPSRAGLLTGRYPLAAGVPGNVSSHRGDAGMPPQQVTLAETLKAAGYATAHIGKWRLGYSENTMPNAQGFDHSFGHMGGCIDNYSHFFYWSGPNRHDLWRNGAEVYHNGRFFQDLMVEEASRFIKAHQNKPFFLYFAMNAPHYPYQGDAKWLEHYKKQNMPYPRNLYAAFLSTQDERIGRLIAEVEQLGLTNHTIIILQSDHGHSTEERAHFGGGNAGPYRGAKFSMFEGGLRIPAVIKWPGHIPKNETRDQIGHGCDWLPTIAELCGVPLLRENIDGKSLTRLIQDPSAPTPHHVLHWQITHAQMDRWAVRQGDWKLLGNPQDTSGKAPLGDEDNLFLVNLAEDIGEITNLRKQFPQKTSELTHLHEAWLTSIKTE